MTGGAGGLPVTGGAGGLPVTGGAGGTVTPAVRHLPLVHVLNGPNLGRLGTREPDVYGTGTYEDLVAECEETAAEVGLAVHVAQTDGEGELVRLLHTAADEAAGVVLNAAA